MKKTPAYFAGVFLLIANFISIPSADAVVPTPEVSLTAAANKISGAAWTNDGSLGGVETLTSSSTLPTYSAGENALILNPTAGLAQYVRGYVSSTTSVNDITFQITMNYVETQTNASSGMILGWWGGYYDIWTQGGNCMGFNTGTSEIWGFNVSSYLNSYHTYTFVMSKTQDNTTNQKIYVDGVQKSLGFCTGSSVTQSQKTWGSANSFTIGIYGSNGSFPTTMRIRNFKLWLSDIGAAAIQESYNSQFPPTSHTIALTSGLNTAVYRTTSTIRSTSDVDGKVTFYFNGKRIPGCINLQTVSKTVTCNWKPSAVNFNNITAQLVAAGGSLATSTMQIFVAKRSSNR